MQTLGDHNQWSVTIKKENRKNKTNKQTEKKKKVSKIWYLAAIGGGGSGIKLNCLGLRMAGQSSLKNINPLTTLVLTNLSWGHLFITERWRQPQIYLNVLKMLCYDKKYSEPISNYLHVFYH